jgi:hypothetical protein
MPELNECLAMGMVTLTFLGMLGLLLWSVRYD